MKQTIEIEVPDGKKAIWKDGKIVFEDIKPQLPKTWKEFCAQNKIRKGECSIDIYGDIIEDSSVGANRNHNYYKNTLPNKQIAKAHLALMQLHQLRDCYRQGWTPNYANLSNKFCIIRYFNSYFKYKYQIAIYTTFSCFLSFQSKEIAEEFLNNFKDLIEQAGDLI